MLLYLLFEPVTVTKYGLNYRSTALNYGLSDCIPPTDGMLQILLSEPPFQTETFDGNSKTTVCSCLFLANGRC